MPFYDSLSKRMHSSAAHVDIFHVSCIKPATHISFKVRSKFYTCSNRGKLYTQFKLQTTNIIYSGNVVASTPPANSTLVNVFALTVEPVVFVKREYSIFMRRRLAVIGGIMIAQFAPSA